MASAKHRFRKVALRMWTDAKFLALSSLPPSGQSLWLWLLTGPFTTNVPGLMRFGEASAAEELGWSPEAFRKAFREVLAQGLAKHDAKARLLWLPRAVEYNEPQSPNVATGWKETWDSLPDCSLKLEAYTALSASLEAFGKPFAKAFVEACRKPSPNQEQEQEQDQEGESKDLQTHVHDESTAPTAAPSAPAVRRKKSSKSSRSVEQQTRSKEINRRYRELYEQHEGHPPAAMDAAENGKLAKFADKYADNAWRIIEWFFAAPEPKYRDKGFPVWLLLLEAETLWHQLNDPRRAVEALAAPVQRRQMAMRAQSAIVFDEAARDTGSALDNPKQPQRLGGPT